MAALDDVVLLECDGTPSLFLIRAARAFICNKIAGFYNLSAYHSSLLLLTQVRKEYDRHERKITGTWNRILALATEIDHNKSSKLSIHNEFFNE